MEEEEWKYGLHTSCVEHYDERQTESEGLLSMRTLWVTRTHRVYAISGWEMIISLFPRSFWSLKVWHLWEGTGVTDMGIHMRGSVPLIEETHSMKWTSSGGQKIRRMWQGMYFTDRFLIPRDTWAFPDTSTGGFIPFQRDVHYCCIGDTICTHRFKRPIKAYISTRKFFYTSPAHWLATLS